VRVFVDQMHSRPVAVFGFVGFRHAAQSLWHALGWTWRP
jgi:hypothetical protein